MEEIEHRKTKIRSPRTNGFVERMNRTLLDECFRVQGRQTWYLEVDEIQRDLDRFMRYYNLERSHQGYRLKGRTPAQALMEALALPRSPKSFPLRRSTSRCQRLLEHHPGDSGVGQIRDLYSPIDFDTEQIREAAGDQQNAGCRAGVHRVESGLGHHDGRRPRREREVTPDVEQRTETDEQHRGRSSGTAQHRGHRCGHRKVEKMTAGARADQRQDDGNMGVYGSYDENPCDPEPAGAIQKPDTETYGARGPRPRISRKAMHGFVARTGAMRCRQCIEASEHSLALLCGNSRS
ncbi:MAG: integrase core domain-containing protein [Gammaproteobacteria bacterium]